MRKLSKFFSLRSEKKLFFRLFRIEAKHWKSQASEAKKNQEKRNGTEKLPK
jgi:hypothetical protein